MEGWCCGRGNWLYMLRQVSTAARRAGTGGLVAEYWGVRGRSQESGRSIANKEHC